MNVASGNLLVEARDTKVAGTGIDIALSHFYNSLDTDVSSVGNGWSMSLGPDDVQLNVQPSGSVTYLGSGGFKAPYVKKTDGSFEAPSGMNADLVKLAAGTYRLTFHGDATHFDFSSAGTLTAIVDRNGNRIQPGYGSSRMTQLTDTQGRVVRLTYGSSGRAAGRLIRMADSSGRKYVYVYGSTGNLSSLTDPSGGKTLFAYGANGLLTSITDPLGRITKVTYNTERRATSVVRVDDPSSGTGPSTTFRYGTDQTTVTDPRGKDTIHQYDSEQRVTRTTDALGHQRSRSYTSNGDSAQDTNQLSGLTTFSYDADNRMMSAEQPAASGFSTGLKSLFDYGTNRQSPSYFYPTSSTDTHGNRTTFDYDAAGNMSSVTNQMPQQNTTRYTYNTNGTVATSTDARGTATSYGYDPAGNLTSINRPAPLGDEAFGNDGLSRVTSRTDGKGQQTNFTYDTLDRVKTVGYAGGITQAYVYDANGNVTSRSGPDGTTTYTYDRLNRLLQTALPDGTISYTYDDAGNLASVQLPSASSPTTYSYGPTGLLSSMTEPGAKTTSFDYDKTGRRTSTTYPNGVVMTQTYDAPGRLKQIKATKSGATLTDFVCTYTKGANDTDLRQTRTNNAYMDSTGQRTTAYTYDGLDRLTRAQDTAGGTKDYQYSYDGASNITSQTINGQTRTYAYNDANELCWAANGAPTPLCAAPPSGAAGYAYDGNGNEIAGGQWGATFTYNSANQTTAFRPSPLFTPIPAAYRGAGQADRSKLGGNEEVSSILGTGVAFAHTSGRDNSGQLVSHHNASGDYYFLFDGLGSVVAQTNANGELEFCYDYTPYGENRPGGACTGRAYGGTPSPWGFAGQQYDIATALYKMGERYYNPEIGRWTQPDPLADRSYGYASADPVNRTDASGLFSVGIDVDVEVGPVRVSGGFSVDDDGRVGVTLGGGGGAGVGVGLKGTVNPGGKVQEGGSIEGGGCISPIVVGPSACLAADSRGGTSVGVGIGSEAGIAYRRTRRLR